ncbi:HD-GYP domain-containing protein [Thalassotalea euphylliae]|uniref:HD-GYP domain-containing protein n=1 Tax=Thalassotalea euphylliae TaxID=1655234 RepID=UPI003633ED52
MLKTLAIDELEVGMFVQEIKLKNSDHKVKNQGKVNSPRTIELLRKQGAASVVVKLNPEQIAKLEQANQSSSTTATQLDNTSDSPKGSVSLSDEFANSCRVYDEATENVKKLFSEAASGQQLTTEKILVLADEITESVFRNEYAMTILTRIRQQANYHWEHAINTAILMCGFGLYLGLNKPTVKKITLGALFHDIGLARVPKAILEKQGPLTTNENSVVQKHISWGIEIGKRDNILNDVVIDMMANHHERLDGSGYPRGIQQDKLSKLARITAIIDVYDAMTGDRAYKKGIPPIAAMRHLMSESEKFDPQLVQKFIKFAGVYPVGSLVKLSNDKLGIITEGNREEPLKPKLKVIYSTQISSLVTPKNCDLTQEDISIVSAVRSEDYQLNLPRLIRDMTM